jgi:cellulose synthase/poly-beta-1,6-N-acetylglucosamine synthase-like glycosyltransferase
LSKASENYTNRYSKLNKINLIKGLFITVIFLIAYDLLFDPSPIIDLAISTLLLAPSYLIFKLWKIKAFKIYFYIQILDLNLVLLVNKLTSPDQITNSLYSNLNYVAIYLSTLSCLIMIAGINNSKILRLNNRSVFNNVRLLSHLFFGTLLIQALIRVS